MYGGTREYWEQFLETERGFRVCDIRVFEFNRRGWALFMSQGICCKYDVILYLILLYYKRDKIR